MNPFIQPSEAEIAFAQYGYKLQALILKESHGWSNKLLESGQRFRGSGQRFDQMGSPHHKGHTLLGQVKVDYLKFLCPRSGEIEIVDILMGHDTNWKPIITVSSTDSDPITIESTGDPGSDMAGIKELVLCCFDRAGLNFR